MFNNPVINLILLLSFVYFISSLMVSSIQETIAAAFSMRRSLLQKALRNLFFEGKAEFGLLSPFQRRFGGRKKQATQPAASANAGAQSGATSANANQSGTAGAPDWTTFLEDTLAGSPHLKSLMKNAERLPAYVPAKNFASAIMDACGFDASDIDLDKPQNTVANLQNKLVAAGGRLPADLKTLLESLLRQSGGKIEALQKGLEDFYDLAMERINDWYKAQVRWIVFLISLALGVALNIDTIQIARDALKNPQVLERQADKIEEILPRLQEVNDSTWAVRNPSGTVDTFRSLPLDSPTAASNRAIPDTVNFIRHEQARIDSLRGLALEAGVRFGYANGSWRKEWFGTPGTHERRVGVFLSKLFGILLTCFALLLGSNYWFDLMNRVVNIRAAGKKPEPNEKDDLRGK